MKRCASRQIVRLVRLAACGQRKLTVGFKFSGGVSGALNDVNDPNGIKRDEHAQRYYEEVRKRNTRHEVEAISKNSQVGRQTVKMAYEHVFAQKHKLENGYTYFTPDYDMAQSWQRLREGKNIQPHDITLLHHEAKEAEYMQQGYSYNDAHVKTCKEGYNYQRELEEWKRSKRG